MYWLFAEKIVDWPTAIWAMRRIVLDGHQKIVLFAATGVKNACGRATFLKNSRVFENRVSVSRVQVVTQTEQFFDGLQSHWGKKLHVKRTNWFFRFFPTFSSHLKISKKFNAGGWCELNNFLMAVLSIAVLLLGLFTQREHLIHLIYHIPFSRLLGQFLTSQHPQVLKTEHPHVLENKITRL